MESRNVSHIIIFSQYNCFVFEIVHNLYNLALMGVEKWCCMDFFLIIGNIVEF
jgi:hypothetical protein